MDIFSCQNIFYLISLYSSFNNNFLNEKWKKKMLAGAAVTWRLDEVWKIWYQGGSITWLPGHCWELTGGFSPTPAGTLFPPLSSLSCVSCSWCFAFSKSCPRAWGIHEKWSANLISGCWKNQALILVWAKGWRPSSTSSPKSWQLGT